jgi:hypothetical protein
MSVERTMSAIPESLQRASFRASAAKIALDLALLEYANATVELRLAEREWAIKGARLK